MTRSKGDKSGQHREYPAWMARTRRRAVRRRASIILARGQEPVAVPADRRFFV